MKIDVDARDRALVLVNGRAKRFLAPGRHRVFALFSKVEVLVLKGTALLADLSADQLALVPADVLQVVAVGPTQRAVVSRRGKAVAVLGAGVHQVLTFETSDPRGAQAGKSLVAVEVLDVSGVVTSPLRDEVKALFPAGEYVEVTAAEGTVALR